MSPLMGFYGLYQFITYIYGILVLKSYFDTKQFFLSSIEAEIIIFLLKKAAIFILAFYTHPIILLRWRPFRIVRKINRNLTFD